MLSGAPISSQAWSPTGRLVSWRALEAVVQLSSANSSAILVRDTYIILCHSMSDYVIEVT